MSNYNYRKMFTVVTLFFFLLTITSVAAAGEYEKGAKTPPPPTQFYPQGFFDPNHDYLLDGSNLFEIYDDNIFRIEGTTVAKQEVDTIGVIFYLQKWDGNSWGDVGSGTSYSDSSESLFLHSIGRSADSGYYYRARTIHCVLHNATYESGERVSNFILMN